LSNLTLLKQKASDIAEKKVNKMELLNKVKKAIHITREQGPGATLQIAKGKLQNRFRAKPRPVGVPEWLAFYERRREINQNAVKSKDITSWPKISILILTYNNLLINQLCLRSIYCNTAYPNFEVIVVDNASVDKTPDWLVSFAKTHPNLKLILNKNNRGFAGGNNQAAQGATGEYLVFLNNDTVVTPGWLERFLAHMQSDSKIGLVGPVTNSTGNEARILVNYDTAAQMESFAAQRARSMAGQSFDIRMLAFYCVIARKNQYETIGGLDERFLVGMFEDDDLAVRYHQAGYRVICAEDIFIHHFQGASFGKLENTQYTHLFEENKQKYEEKWGRKWEPYQFRKDLLTPEPDKKDPKV